MAGKQFRTNHEIEYRPEDVSDGILNLFDLDNPDVQLFNMVDDELIRVAGSPVFLYKFLESSKNDDVYQENTLKVIADDPITLWAHYEPRPIDEALTEFGIVLENDQTFTFNKSYAERVLGRPVIPGDILMPKFQNVKYEVYEVQEDAFEVYGVYHLLCWTRILRDDDEITRKEQDFSQDEVY
jgi:hypothetical protein